MVGLLIPRFRLCFGCLLGLALLWLALVVQGGWAHDSHAALQLPSPVEHQPAEPQPDPNGEGSSVAPTRTPWPSRAGHFASATAHSSPSLPALRAGWPHAPPHAV